MTDKRDRSALRAFAERESHSSRTRLCVVLGSVLAIGGMVQETGAAETEQIDRDLSNASISELQGYYESGKYTVTEVTRWHLARIRRYELDYNAFIEVFQDEAVARASMLDEQSRAGAPRGALWGVPVAVKGSISIAGQVTTVGWWGYTVPGFELRARRSATVIERLIEAGAVILGHSNLPDLAKSDTTTSSVAGRTANAYHRDYSPGGSSGGSATAVAVGFAVVALGTDGGNSIRNPSSASSLVGVLPTHGLISIAGVHAGDWLKERTGPMTRTVEDAAIMLDVLSGYDSADPKTAESNGHIPDTFRKYLVRGSLKGKRFGVPKFILDGTPTTKPNPKYWHYGTSPATRAAFLKAVRDLEKAGATVVFDDDILPESFGAIAARIKTSRYHRQGVSEFMKHYGPPTYTSTEQFEALVGVNYPVDGMGGPDSGHVLESDPDALSEYVQPLADALRVYRETLDRYDLDGFVYPALQVPPTNESVALPRDYPSDGPYSATAWANRLGIPAIVVPAGYYGNGLPFGLEFASDKWRDGELLSFAYDFEQATGYRKSPSLATSR